MYAPSVLSRRAGWTQSRVACPKHGERQQHPSDEQEDMGEVARAIDADRSDRLAASCREARIPAVNLRAEKS